MRSTLGPDRAARRERFATWALGNSLLVVAVACLSVACSGAFPRPEGALAAPVAVQEGLAARLAAIHDVRIKAKADYWDTERGERVVGREISISALAPASMRVSVSSFGTVLASLASDGVDFSMLDLQNNVYYYGPATPENISKLIPIFLEGEDFVSLLRGGMPTAGLPANWVDLSTLSWNSKTGEYRLATSLPGGREQFISLTYPELAVSGLRIREDGKDVYVYEAKEFAAVDGYVFPQKSRFTIVDEEIEVTIWVEQLDINLAPRAQIFRIPPPAGVEHVPVGVLSAAP